MHKVSSVQCFYFETFYLCVIENSLKTIFKLCICEKTFCLTSLDIVDMRVKNVVKILSASAALHFDDQLRVHAKRTDISVFLSPLGELCVLLSLSLSRACLSFLLRFSSSFSPFFPRSRSQILTYDYASCERANFVRKLTRPKERFRGLPRSRSNSGGPVRGS